MTVGKLNRLISEASWMAGHYRTSGKQSSYWRREVKRLNRWRDELIQKEQENG